VHGLKAVLDYIKNDDKTLNGKLIYGKDCLTTKTFESMMLTKQAFMKIDGRQYEHFIHSFAKDDDITPETALEISRKMIEGLPQFKDYQVLLATHTDKEHIHTHIVVNSVSGLDGKKWQRSPKDLQAFREKSDELCKSYGLSVIEKAKKGWKSYGEYKKNSWKEKLADDISKTVTTSTTREEFYHKLSRLGINADFNKSSVMFSFNEQCGENYGITGGRKCSNKKLESYGDFSVDNLNKHLSYNDKLWNEVFDNPVMLRNTLMTVGEMLFPNDPDRLSNQYLARMNFNALTEDEILGYIKREELKRVAESNSATRSEEKAKKEKNTQSIKQMDYLFSMLEKRLEKDYGHQKHYRNEYVETEEDEEEFEL
jgi:hypothetical protein